MQLTAVQNINEFIVIVENHVLFYTIDIMDFFFFDSFQPLKHIFRILYLTAHLDYDIKII